MAHDAFLRAILESPDDDAPRLIYADWLDDHGDADRAEFIRLQCALAASNAGRRQRAFEAREDELLARHHEEWAGPIRPLLKEWKFRRGFVAWVRVEGLGFSGDPAAILRRAPVQDLQLYWGLSHPRERARLLARACACPDLTRLRSLELSGNYLGSAGTQALAACEYLTGLTHLDLSRNHVGDGGLRALASSALLPRLTHLDLGANDITPTGIRCLTAGVRALEAAGRTLRLRVLNLRGNPLHAAGHREVWADPTLRRIALVSREFV